jgi:hypothetical protein
LNVTAAARREPPPARAGSIRPFWIPPDVDFDRLPKQLQAAICGVVEPAYEQLVVRATPGLEQSTGMTIVSLLALEVFEQIETHEGLYDGQRTPHISEQREKEIARMLRLIGAKIKASGFLLRLHEFRQKWGHLPNLPYEPIPPGGHWAEESEDDAPIAEAPRAAY